MRGVMPALCTQFEPPTSSQRAGPSHCLGALVVDAQSWAETTNGPACRSRPHHCDRRRSSGTARAPRSRPRPGRRTHPCRQSAPAARPGARPGPLAGSRASTLLHVGRAACSKTCGAAQQAHTSSPIHAAAAQPSPAHTCAVPTLPAVCASQLGRLRRRCCAGQVAPPAARVAADVLQVALRVLALAAALRPAHPHGGRSSNRHLHRDAPTQHRLAGTHLTKSFSPAQGQLSEPQRRHTATALSQLAAWRWPFGQSRAMWPGRWHRQHRLLGQSRLSWPNCKRAGSLKCGWHRNSAAGQRPSSTGQPASAALCADTSHAAHGGLCRSSGKQPRATASPGHTGSRSAPWPQPCNRAQSVPVRRT